jgi:hypothetical protein
MSKKEDGRFVLINFHPAGEPEAFIGKALKGEAIVYYAEPLITQHMKASGSCKI